MNLGLSKLVFKPNLDSAPQFDLPAHHWLKIIPFLPNSPEPSNNAKPFLTMLCMSVCTEKQMTNVSTVFNWDKFPTEVNKHHALTGVKGQMECAHFKVHILLLWNQWEEGGRGSIVSPGNKL